MTGTSNPKHFTWFAVLICLAFSTLASGQTTFIVNTYTDIADTDGTDGVCDNGFGLCSLREAVQEANDLAGADTILLPPGTYEMTIGGANEDGCLTGDLDITDDLSIIGLQGSHIESQVGRVLHVLSGNVTFTGLTLSNGDGAGEVGTNRAGGAVYNAGGGVVTLNNCTMTANQGRGGAGVYNDTGGTLTINTSTLTENSAGGVGANGGAVWNKGTMTVTNSTISGNQLTGSGGGIYNDGAGATLNLNNATVAFNSASSGDGGGIANNLGTVNISNTILSNNSASSVNKDCFGTFVSGGHNVVQNVTGCIGFNGTGDLNMNPLLGPLQNNGGLTFTHALQTTPTPSPAIDAGDPTLGVCEDTDQRGLSRPQGAACDIGAFEVFPSCPTVTLDPLLLPPLFPGQFFTQQITPTGGVAPYTFAVTGGTMPAGLSLDPLTGILSGVPLVGGSYSFTVTAFDANFCPGSQTYSFSCPLITLSPLLLPEATQGQNYSQTITATGGTGPYLFTVIAGFLPLGVTLNPSTGQLSGSPTTPGDFFFVIRATDSATLCTGSQPYTLVVQCALALAPSTLPHGREGALYNAPTGVQLTATGGTSGYTFSLFSGLLPTGMFLDGTGLLHGTPDPGTAGDYTIIVKAIDAFNCAGTILYTLTIDPCIVLTPDVLPTATANTPYTQTLVATGGVGAITFTAGNGLPPGITLSAGGVFDGTPTTAGVYTFDVSATDGTCNVTKSYTIIVSPAGCPAITLSPLTLPIGTQGSPYSQALTPSGGTAPYTFVLVTGALPSGVTLDTNTGVISGTPTAFGIFDFTVAAADTNFCAGSHAYTLLISPTGCAAITLSPLTLPDGAVGAAYNQVVVASGGSGVYTYFFSGTLPDGLTLDTTTGIISGTPTTAGSFSFTIGAVDGNLCFGGQAYTINITGTAGCGLFNDDFADNTVDWTVEKPGWTETGGNLSGTPTGKKAIINARPLFTGCSGPCSFHSTMMTAGGLFNKLWMLNWYTDKKNTVEVLMKQENNKFVLRQRINGVIVAKTKGLATLAPNVAYDVQVTFDGTVFTLIVDGNPIATLNAAGAVSGTIGFAVKNTTGTFGFACVE